MSPPLETIAGIRFKNTSLLQQVFVHRSFVNENRSRGMEHNERLEFLGDAVLELLITKCLFEQFPQAQEGELTALRSALVRKENLAQLAREIQLGEYLQLSKGEAKSGGREKDYLLANTYEALIGAIFLDQGIITTEKFVMNYVLPSIKTILQKKLHIDHKSALQEYTQEKLKVTPTYRVIESQGPDHEKTFVMGVFLDEKLITKGTGASKRKAEEEAAQKALKKLMKKA